MRNYPIKKEIFSFLIISHGIKILFTAIRHISLLSVPVIWLSAMNAVLLQPNLI